MILGGEYEVIERLNSDHVKIITSNKVNKSYLRLKEIHPDLYQHRQSILVSEFDDLGNKFFKTREEIREEKLNLII
jgi:hypothetical protein